MPLFKKSNDGQRQAELELQQSTLNMIHSDTGTSSLPRHNNSGPWYTPTSINTVPHRSSTPRTGSLISSLGFSPASTTASRATSRASTPQSSVPPRSPPPVIITPPPAADTPNTNRTNANAGISTRTSTPAQWNPGHQKTPVQRNGTGTPRKSAESDQKQNSILSKISNFKIPSPRKGKDEADVSRTKSPSSRKGGASPSPWAPSGRGAGTPTVKVITRDGEKQIPVDQLTPNMRPRPGNVPKITRKIQTDPVDENFQRIEPEKEPEWYVTYKKYKKPIWIIFAIIVLVLVIIIAFAASGNTATDYNGAFAMLVGEPCNHFCKPGEYSTAGSDTPLVVLALDGFRADYLQKYKKDLPNLRRLSECGVTADMRASFPATTAPNLWTIVSGYYPQFHGIVSDWILDHKTDEEFAPRTDPTGYGSIDAGWYHDPALWQLARHQGKITASHSWLGNNLGEVEDDHHPGETEDRSPTYYKPFGNTIDYMTRIDDVLEWLNLPANQRPTFTTVYFEDPGRTGRKYGASSNEVLNVLKEIDTAIGHLFDELMRRQIVDCVNFMVVSTNGMVDTHCDDVYYLVDDIRDIDDYIISPDYLGSMARITPKASAPYDMDTEEKVIQYLQCKVDHGQAYLTDFLPSRLHGAYGHHLEEAAVLMQNGWTFAKEQTGYNRDNCRGANDGYDPFLEDMMCIFIGFGKDFKIGHRLKPFQNIQLFNLMTDLIGVEPSTTAPPSDGIPGYLNNALKKPGPDPGLPWGLVGPRNNRCQYPDERRTANEGCTCPADVLNMYPETAGINLEEKDVNLNRRGSTALVERNAPFGLPAVKDDINPNGEYFCILYQNNYITGYDHFLEIPIFVSFTIDSSTGSVPVLEDCLRYDQRLEPTKTPRCTDYDNGVVDDILHLQPTFLYQPLLAGNIDAELDALITSNVVPMYIDFAREIWKPVSMRLRDWASEVKHIHVAAGPIYDLNRDSTKDRYFDIGESNLWVGDTPVPTHYFLVVTRCLNNSAAEDTPLKECSYDRIATMTFIFPHTNELPNEQCFNFDEYLMSNRATVQDVERLSGLAFYPNWSMDLETQMRMLRFKSQFQSANSPWVEF
ncbi:venom phosphodiesterase 2-like isoform X2 [Amphiura filiformis]|uniref:venom phosphodiesterase 2-like isoform X2 n=1 Tax=Amphiura filiformis TaxID=82378 RepID=UPI003B21705A